ncbi:MAG: hypothetical protein VR70_12345 [Rhodospirillaceae bacterium BRH_c57]|nr:MAG: hypothetical protein VR70_12345 [Rhodospirillaceae bacterium BRH_c57]
MWVDGVDWPTQEQIQPLTELQEAHQAAFLSCMCCTADRPYQHMSLSQLSVYATDIEKSVDEAVASNELTEVEMLGIVLDDVLREIAHRVF